MPFSPLRFLHADSLRLDSQLLDVDACPDEQRGLMETATITAFERVIDTCLTERVDFLLLTGNSFDERDRSLPARLALGDGFRQLEQQEIRVFVLPGRLDPSDAWRELSALPDNVTAFLEAADEAVAVLRDGKVIASVACIDKLHGGVRQHAAGAEAGDPSRRGPFRIGLYAAPRHVDDAADHSWLSAASPTPAVDYLGVGCAPLRQTASMSRGIAHSPGSTQALGRREPGLHGCTLVEVAADGTLECRLVPTAPVRIDNFAIGVDAQSSQADLLERMRELLDRQPTSPAESLWLVNWTLAGSGPLYERLCDRDLARQFVELLDRELATGLRPSPFAHPMACHSLLTLPDRAAVAQVRQEEAWADAFFAALEADVPLSPRTLRQCVESNGPASDELAVRLADLADRVDCRVVLGKARQFGIARLRRAANSEG